MAEIARRAGVVRATIYVHFPTREALIDAVTRRAIEEVADVIDTAQQDDAPVKGYGTSVRDAEGREPAEPQSRLTGNSLATSPD